MAIESSVLGHHVFSSGLKFLYPMHEIRTKRIPMKVLGTNSRCLFPIVSNCVGPFSSTTFHGSNGSYGSSYVNNVKLVRGTSLKMKCLGSSDSESVVSNSNANLKFIDEFLVKSGIVLAATVCGVLVFGCPEVFASEGVVKAGYGVIGKSILLLKSTWPTVLQVLRLFKEQGLLLALLLGLSAFFSLAETSITTLWPWKVRELAEKETENGVFRLLRSDVTRFLTTILIGTTVVNIAATALVTEAATAAFGEAGVSAATGVMTYFNMLTVKLANS